jgi:hypothetical protein
MELTAAPLKGSVGYAANAGGICAHVSASTSNNYGAPDPPSGWSALVYVEMKFADRHAGDWSKTGPAEFVEITGRHAFNASQYFCAIWFIASGSQWNEAWTSATTRRTTSRRLRLAGAHPDFTPFFNGPFVLKTNTVMEVLEPPGDDRC